MSTSAFGDASVNIQPSTETGTSISISVDLIKGVYLPLATFILRQYNFISKYPNISVLIYWLYSKRYSYLCGFLTCYREN